MSLVTMPQIQFYVQDVSYVEPNFAGDRVVFIPVISPKGPEGIRLMSSPSQIERYYGKPDAEKYGYSLYFALKAALYTTKVYVMRVLPDDAAYSNKMVKVDNSDYTDVKVAANFSDVDTIELNDVSQVSVNDKIYFGNNIENVYTVTNVDAGASTIKLDQKVTVTADTPVHKFPTSTLLSFANLNSPSEVKGTMDANDALIAFYPVGRGKFYDNLRVILVRNTVLENLYVDDNGNPLFPYMFVDVYVYEKQEDGGMKLLEGPITCSLVNKIAGNTVRHPSSGRELFIGTRINEDSEFIRVEYDLNDIVTKFYGTGENDTQAHAARKSFVESLSDFVALENGSDGSLFDAYGKLNYTTLTTLLSSVFNGTYDDECAKLLDTQYQYYPIDYIVDAGFPTAVKAAMVDFVEARRDVLALIAMPDNSKYTQDVEARNSDTPYNSYNAMLYSQWRKMIDPYTGKEVWFPPTYHALECHLKVDNTLGIAEPVAMFKATIDDPIELRYSPIFAQANELTNKQINPTIKEPDGVYIPTQYTTYRRLSVLQRAHVVKVIHRFRKEIPKILKDLLQTKATPDKIKEAERRVRHYLNGWMVGGPIAAKEAIENYKLNVFFDEINKTLYVTMDVNFVDAIEFIVISLNVVG